MVPILSCIGSLGGGGPMGMGGTSASGALSGGGPCCMFESACGGEGP